MRPPKSSWSTSHSVAVACIADAALQVACRPSHSRLVPSTWWSRSPVPAECPCGPTWNRTCSRRAGMGLLDIDLGKLIGPDLSLLETVLRGTAMYFVIFVLLRLVLRG